MNVAAEIRKRVVENGKMKYGAQSRLAQLLGLRQSKVRASILGDRPFTKEELAKLKEAIRNKTPLFTVQAEKRKCSCGCGEPAYSKGLSRSCYYRQWRAGILGAVSL